MWKTLKQNPNMNEQPWPPCGRKQEENRKLSVCQKSCRQCFNFRRHVWWMWMRAVSSKLQGFLAVISSVSINLVFATTSGMETVVHEGGWPQTIEINWVAYSKLPRCHFCGSAGFSRTLGYLMPLLYYLLKSLPTFKKCKSQKSFYPPNDSLCNFVAVHSQRIDFVS